MFGLKIVSLAETAGRDTELSDLRRQLELQTGQLVDRDREIAQLSDRLANVRSPALSGGSDDLLTERLLSHPVPALPGIGLGSSPATEHPQRIAVAERLLAAYHAAIRDEAKSDMPREGEDMWTQILRDELPELVEAIDEKDAEKLAHFLTRFGSSFVWFGGVSTSVDGYNRNLDSYHVAMTYWDKLLRLAEYLGVLAFENPEAGPWGVAVARNPVAVVAAIEKEIGISVFGPEGVIHTDGLRIGSGEQPSGGLLHYRHINSLYAALRLTRLAPTGAACEYGGGVGLIAYYVRKLGMRDYTILDLPITCLLSAHFLMLACGPDEVGLYGETTSDEQIKVLPYWTCRSFADDRFAISLNQDGMNEIADNLRETYRDEIARTTRDYFLSFNHEVFFPKTVRALMAGDPRYACLSRAPYWPREGYVEELFELRKGTAG